MIKHKTINEDILKECIDGLGWPWYIISEETWNQITVISTDSVPVNSNSCFFVQKYTRDCNSIYCEYNTMDTCAKYLINSLRINDANVFPLAAFTLYIRELCYTLSKGYHSDDYATYMCLKPVLYYLAHYIETKYNLCLYNALDHKYSGLRYMPRIYPYTVAMNLKNNTDMRNFLYFLYDTCQSYWHEFFSTYAIKCCNPSSYYTCHYVHYDENWLDYILYKGEPCICRENTYDNNHFISVRYLLALQKYATQDIENGQIFSLDKNIFNFKLDNIGLFKTKEDYIRWYIGGCDYEIQDGLYVVTQEVTRQELKNLLPKYTLEKIQKMLHITPKALKKYIETFNLPGRKEALAMSEEEYAKV